MTWIDASRKGHTAGQQTYEKMLDVIKYHRNANKNNKISPYICQNGYHQ